MNGIIPGVRRIDGYLPVRCTQTGDGETVRYHYRLYKTERVEEERVDVYAFIGRMIQHILPKGFKRIRYYGVQATKTFEQVKGIIREAFGEEGNGRAIRYTAEGVKFKFQVHCF